MNETIQHPTHWSNKPWSFPPCPNDRPDDGVRCSLVIHQYDPRTDVVTHSGEVGVSRLYLPLGAKRRKRATYYEWQSWQTRGSFRTGTVLVS